MKRALSAALPNSQQGCIGALEDDFYANSSKPSQAGYYNTWSRFAAAWQMPPIPITKQLLLAIGASMKHATVPPQNYIYKAAQLHPEILEEELPAHLHQLLQKIIRSIKRGQGPTPFKDPFELELFNIPLERSHAPRQGQWFHDRFAARDIIYLNILLVDAQRHRGCCGQTTTHLVPRDPHQQVCLLHPSSTEERPDRTVREQRPPVHMSPWPIQSIMPLPCDSPTLEKSGTYLSKRSNGPDSRTCDRHRRFSLQVRHSTDILICH